MVSISIHIFSHLFTQLCKMSITLNQNCLNLTNIKKLDQSQIRKKIFIFTMFLAFYDFYKGRYTCFESGFMHPEIEHKEIILA